MLFVGYLQAMLSWVCSTSHFQYLNQTFFKENVHDSKLFVMGDSIAAHCEEIFFSRVTCLWQIDKKIIKLLKLE